MKIEMDSSWRTQLRQEFSQLYFRDLECFVDQSRSSCQVFPAEENVFRAFQLTTFEQTKVVLLGQDPYHDQGQAHGLAFSVQPGTAHPPSLRNIFKEMQDDLGKSVPKSGDLSLWARQGVLLLNTVLTVEAHTAHSHQKQGWERFTDSVIARLGEREQHTVFLLWGKPAQQKERLIDRQKHTILKAPHPSPLSAYRGFFGSSPFSRTNQALLDHGQSEIDWSLEPSSGLDC